MRELVVQGHYVGFMCFSGGFDKNNIALGNGTAFGLVISDLIRRECHAGLLHDHIAGGEEAAIFLVDHDIVGLETDILFGGERRIDVPQTQKQKRKDAQYTMERHWVFTPVKHT